MPDVQRQAGSGQPGAELPGAQEASQAASTSGSSSNTSTTPADVTRGADRVLDGRTTDRSVKRTSSSERPLALRSEPGIVALPARRFRGEPPGAANRPEGSYSVKRLEAASRPARTGAIPGRSACGRGAPAHQGLASGRRPGPDRRRQQARRILAGGILTDSHEPGNRLARTDHGLHGDGCAGRMYTEFPALTQGSPHRPFQNFVTHRSQNLCACLPAEL